MSEVAAILEAVQKLSGVSFLAGFATMLVVIGVAHYRRVWEWGYISRERLAEAKTTYETSIHEWKARLATSEAVSTEWKQTALGLLGVAETSVKTVAKRTGG